MQKLIAAVYGEKAVDVLKDTFEKLTDEQRYDLMYRIIDVLEDVKDKIEVSAEQLNVILESTYERALEIMPGLKDKLDKELKEIMD